jgi:hypothetical protein
MGAPQLSYWLISLLPKAWWKPAGHFLNVLYDVLSVLLLYGTILWLGQSEKSFFPQEQVADIAFFSCLLFLTTPALFGLLARLKSIGARTFGGLFTLMYFICLGGGLISGHWLWYLGCFASGTITIFASQFGLQHLIFTSLFLAAFYQSFTPILILISTFLTAFISKKDHFLHYVRQKTNHYKWYFNNSHGLAPDTRNRVQDFISLPKLVFSGKSGRKRFLELITRR